MANRHSFLKHLKLGLFGLGGLHTTSKQTEELDEVKFRIAHVTDQHVTSRRKDI